MELEFLWKCVASGNGDCPSAFKATRNGLDGYILVGDSLTSDEAAQVAALGRANNSGVAATETAVFVPADVIDRFRS